MRKLNYLVLGFTSMFTAVAFAQALNTGIQERTIVQAQADGQMGGRSPTGTSPMGASPDPMEHTDQGKSKDPMASEKAKEKHKGGYGTSSRGKQDQLDPHDASSQARKGKTNEGGRPSGE